jgi:hypothetical protein
MPLMHDHSNVIPREIDVVMVTMQVASDEVCSRDHHIGTEECQVGTSQDSNPRKQA